MEKYDEVLRILRDEDEWPVFCSPAPNATALALETQEPKEVASTLTSAVWAQTNAWRGFDQACYDLFQTGRKYWELDTAIVLGQQHEVPVEKQPRAETVGEWLALMDKGFTRQGYRDENSAPWTEQGKLRRAAAELPPLEWTLAGKRLAWRLAVLSGTIPVGLTGFDPAYAQRFPRLRDLRGIDEQQWLEQMNARDDGKVNPWPVQK